MEAGLILGIDLCEDYSQICYYDYKGKSVESVGLSIRESKYQIPTAVCKQKGKNEWCAGDDAVKSNLLDTGVYVDNLLSKVISDDLINVEDITVNPHELLTIFLKYLITAAEVRCQKKEIQKVYVTVSVINKHIVKAIKNSLIELGINKEDIRILNHQESYIYYAMSQSKELWNSDVALFDYTKDGLDFYRMYIGSVLRKKIVMIEHIDYANEFAIEDIEKNETDEKLLLEVKKLFDKKIINTVYFTGVGFNKSDWLKGTFGYICNKRRVFLGQNLFVKGACYAALEDINDNILTGYTIACKDRITTKVEVLVSKQSKEDERLILVKEGSNWSDADIDMDFIVNDENNVKLLLTPADTGIYREEIIKLDKFPKRPPKTTRINMKIEFNSDSCMMVTIKDKGFGEFFKASYETITKEITL